MASGTAPENIDFINAHGTGTPLNDTTESTAIIAVMGGPGRNVPVSSTKSLHGHLLGASGAIELAATLAVLEAQTVGPTLGWHKNDPEIGINLIKGEPLEVRVETALSASYAFGGHNTVLAVRRAAR